MVIFSPPANFSRQYYIMHDTKARDKNIIKAKLISRHLILVEFSAFEFLMSTKHQRTHVFALFI
jgi:hypothetical protein